MPATDTPIAPAKTFPEPITRPALLPVEDAQVKRQPPYTVILHNDDLNGFDYVVGVLQKVFNYGRLKAFRLTLKAHLTGQSAVWMGSLEVAELKADQVRSCGPDPRMQHRGALALSVSVERLPD